jgi:hypothetical protein
MALIQRAVEMFEFIGCFLHQQVEKQVKEVECEREELGLGRSLDSHAVAHEQAQEQAQQHLPDASIHVWRVQ